MARVNSGSYGHPAGEGTGVLIIPKAWKWSFGKRNRIQIALNSNGELSDSGEAHRDDSLEFAHGLSLSNGRKLSPRPQGIPPPFRDGVRLRCGRAIGPLECAAPWCPPQVRRAPTITPTCSVPQDDERFEFASAPEFYSRLLGSLLKIASCDGTRVHGMTPFTRQP